MMRHLDLFSGIGGFSLGLEKTGGFETVAFCEIAEYPRKVLKKHWPRIKCYPDIKKLTYEQLKKDGVYESLEERSTRLAAGLASAAQKAGVAAKVDHVGSMLGMFFTDRNVACFDDAKTCDLELFARFYQGMRRQGVYIAPSQFEVLFLSTAHADEYIDVTVNAAEQALENLTQ